MQIQKPNVFFANFLESVRVSKRKVLIWSMNFEDGENIRILVKELVDALARGVVVEINIDWVYQYYNDGVAPIFFRVSAKQSLEAGQLRNRSNELLQLLRSNGAVVRINNTPVFPFNFFKIFGRDHRKIYCVDDQQLWIGGVNLYQRAFSKLDLMLMIDDRNLIEKITHFLTQTHNGIIDFEGGAVLFDGGKIGESIIYNEATRLVDGAQQSIVFVSQFLPDFYLIRKFAKKVADGVSVHIFTSKVSDRKFTTFPGKGSYEMSVRRIQKANISLTHLADTTVHAKILLIDDVRYVLGSHNLILHGVLLATEEIAVTGSDKKIVQKIKHNLGLFAQ